jgi:hypothetical protein
VYLIIEFRLKALDGSVSIITYMTLSSVFRTFVNAFKGTTKLKPPFFLSSSWNLNPCVTKGLIANKFRPIQRRVVRGETKWIGVRRYRMFLRY